MSDRKNILVVCDDELISQLTQKRLEILGYDSMVAPSAEAARSVFPHDSETIDLVIVDHILSDGDGVDLASEFLDIRPGIPVALYTGGALTIEEVQSRGISAVIPKVLTMEEFTEELKRVFDTE